MKNLCLSQLTKTVLLLVFVVTALVATGQKEVGLYSFGHSLVEYHSPDPPYYGDETTVAFWVNEIAKAAEQHFFAGGQYGFLTTHDDLPPIAQWGYKSILPVWEEEEESFAESKVSSVLLTAANFIQFTAPDAPHPLDQNTTVIQSTKEILDWVKARRPMSRSYIYANWPEIDLKNGFPPSEEEQQQFHTAVQGAFTDWWVDYQDILLEERSDLKTRLIPVGKLISEVVTRVLPQPIPFDSLYVDGDPHGRPTIYFLAGAITYMALFEQLPPQEYAPDKYVHASIKEHWPTIREFLWDALLAFNFPNGSSRVFYSPSTATVPEAHPHFGGINFGPNPSRGRVLVTGLEEEVLIDVLNAQGVRLETYRNVRSGDVIKLPGESPGLYFIRSVGLKTNTVTLHRIVRVD